MDPRGRRDPNVVAQHTFGHIDCPGCESLRESIVSGRISAGDTLREAATAWLESRTLAGNLDRARFISPRTLRDYRQYLNSILKVFDGIHLDQIGAGQLRQYQIERSLEAGPGKVNQEMRLLQRLLRAAGVWTAEMQESYRPLQVSHPDVPRAMSPEEQCRFLEVAASRRQWQLVYWFSLVVLETSCAHGEMRGLHVGDVDFFQRILEVRSQHAKNKYRVRTIELSELAIWALERIVQRAHAMGSMLPQHYLFPCQIARGEWNPQRPMSASGLKRNFDAVRKLAGVPWFRPNGLRHTALTRFAEAGMPIANMMSMAGHVTARMTQHYTHVSRSANRKAVEAFEDRRTVRLGPLAVGTGKG